MSDRTNVTMVPRCECGYIFDELRIGREGDGITREACHYGYAAMKELQFEPPFCPRCGKRIELLGIPRGMEQAIRGEL
jgi:hypothetical protein